MSVEGFKRVVVGESMPDKDDPKYRARYEREVAAGRRFGEMVGIARFGGWLCRVADRHRKWTVGLILCLCMFFFLYNFCHLVVGLGSAGKRANAVEYQDSVFRNRFNNK